MKIAAAVISFLLTVHASVAADDEIVVSATRVPTSTDAVGSSITVVTPEDIAARQKNSAVRLLEQTPGLHFTQNGGAGSLGSLFIRGAQTEQTLFLVDGIEVNDPISPGRAPFLANIDMVNVERIEIVRGPQSGLYGSDAMAGAVNIITREGKGSPSAFFSFEAGSYKTFREAAGLNGQSGKTSYSFGASRFDTDGFSSANEEDGNSEDDGSKRTTLSGKVGHRFSRILELKAVGRYVDSESEFDASGGPGGDAADNVSSRESLLGSLGADIDLMDSAWQQTIRLSAADHDRTSESDWDDTSFDSSLLKGEWQNDLYLEENHILTLGAEAETEEGETGSIEELSSDTVSVYAQDMFSWKNLKMAIGGRWDDREDFSEETTYRLAPAYRIEQTATTIKGSYGTGFKTPSLYQLYAPATEFGPIGNESLEPEESTAWDFGVEQEFADGETAAGITYFAAEYRDMIDFSSEGYVNRDEVDTSGVELFFDIGLTEKLSVNGNYTYLVAEDAETGEQLDRRPENRAFAELAYVDPGNASLSVNGLYVGERTDSYYDASMFEFVNTDLDEYFVLNVAGSYNITPGVELMARIDNVLDEDYEESAGYGTPGLSAYGGFKITL